MAGPFGFGAYVKVRSWHLQSGLMSRGGMIHTLCGRWAAKDAPASSTFPANERTCETCYRLKAQGDQ